MPEDSEAQKIPPPYSIPTYKEAVDRMSRVGDPALKPDNPTERERRAVNALSTLLETPSYTDSVEYFFHGQDNIRHIAAVLIGVRPGSYIFTDIGKFTLDKIRDIDPELAAEFDVICLTCEKGESQGKITGRELALFLHKESVLKKVQEELPEIFPPGNTYEQCRDNLMKLELMSPFSAKTKEEQIRNEIIFGALMGYPMSDVRSFAIFNRDNKAIREFLLLNMFTMKDRDKKKIDDYISFMDTYDFGSYDTKNAQAIFKRVVERLFQILPKFKKLPPVPDDLKHYIATTWMWHAAYGIMDWMGRYDDEASLELLNHVNQRFVSSGMANLLAKYRLLGEKYVGSRPKDKI